MERNDIIKLLLDDYIKYNKISGTDILGIAIGLGMSYQDFVNPILELVKKRNNTEVEL